MTLTFRITSLAFLLTAFLLPDFHFGVSPVYDVYFILGSMLLLAIVLNLTVISLLYVCVSGVLRTGVRSCSCSVTSTVCMTCMFPSFVVHSHCKR